MDTNTQRDTHQFGAIATTPDAVQANRVLRNTYALLALSMIPTALGAWFGTDYAAPFLLALSPMWRVLAFLGVAWGLMWAINKNRDNSAGVLLLLAFTGLMGVWMGPMLSHVLHFRNGMQLITMAAGSTGAIFFVLAGIASSTKRDFSNIGKFLLVGLVLVFLAALANAFFQIPAVSLAISSVAVLLFSGYVLYDINRIVHGGETNYVTATLAVYLNLYNIFMSLLNIFSALFGERD